MKYFVIAVVLCAVVSVQSLTDEQKAKVKQSYGECLASTGVDKTVVENGRKGEFADDPKLKQFISCFLKKSEIQSASGEIQADVIKAKLGADFTGDEIDAVLAKCKSSGGSAEDVASEFWKCYWNNAPKHIPLV